MLRRTITTTTLTLMLLLALGMAAWACTNLATLNLSASQGDAGTAVDVHGSAFSTSDGAQPVEVRWDGADGEVLATAEPDDTGTIATSVTVPGDAEPGYHVLVATQMVEGDEGEASPAFGTPARSSFLVGNAEPEQIGQTAGPPTTGVGAAGPSATVLGLTALLGLIGLGLFGAGLGLFVRQARRRPAQAPVRAPR